VNATPVSTPSNALCRHCQQQPPQAGLETCLPCHIAKAQNQLWADIMGVWGRWIISSPFTAVLALGVGCIMLMAAAIPPIDRLEPDVLPFNIGATVVVALMVAGCTQIFLKKTIHHWNYWGLLSGLEIVIGWCAVVGLVALVGRVPGITALASAIVGVGIAVVQARLLRPQVLEPQRWPRYSAGVWVCVGGRQMRIELLLRQGEDGPSMSLLLGIAAARLAYWPLAGSVLCWMFWQKSYREDTYYQLLQPSLSLQKIREGVARRIDKIAHISMRDVAQVFLSLRGSAMTAIMMLGPVLFYAAFISALPQIAEYIINIFRLPLDPYATSMTVFVLFHLISIFGMFFIPISEDQLIDSIPIGNAIADMGDANWQQLASHYRDGDEIWRWSTPAWMWESLMGREGYVIVRKGRPTRHRIVTGMN